MKRVFIMVHGIPTADPDQLSDVISALMEEGYDTHGPLMIREGYFLQPMKLTGGGGWEAKSD